MAYQIEPQSITDFIQDEAIRLPRFQRKKTWKPAQNFELCISVFKQYPIGVFILNKEGKKLWLLDGRQRREALCALNSDPTKVYEWAKAFLKFKTTDDPEDVEKIFWCKIEDYLQKEKDTNNNSDENEQEDIDSDSEMSETTFDSREQSEGLKTLLDYILLSHGKNSLTNKFKFAKIFIRKGKFNLEKLIDFLLKIGSKEQFNEDSFMDLYEDETTDTEEIEECRKNVSDNWKYIKKTIEILSRYKRVLKDARLGRITLVNATPLDAQNIFTLVNKGGTPLTAEELLSAKPFWNEIIPEPSDLIKEVVRNLYHRLEIQPVPENVCRWDIVATIISKIQKKRKKNNLFFKIYLQSDKLSSDEITLSFKLLSSIIIGGMSSVHVAKLEQDKTINWETVIDEIIDTILEIEEVLLEKKTFQCLAHWDKSIMDLTSTAVTLEFITILYKQWFILGCPPKNSTARKLFQQQAQILLDRLIFEYVSGGWKGSGDSKLATDIKKLSSRVAKPVGSGEWEDCLSKMCHGELDFRPVMLYYDCMIRRIIPTGHMEESVEIDHIIPKDLLKTSISSGKIIDCLGNRCLLPKKQNAAKKDLSLNQISDPWLIGNIGTYAGIKKNDFEKFSSPEQLDDLLDYRFAFLKKNFLKKRKAILRGTDD
ncbi:MAG: DUF262 domain-containing protein [Thermoguttaceae bacterium]|nr:DUF262 domain-containing protein [Thermoguttaceae bacterium]